MLKPSDFNNAVPQFQNGNYASNPINPQYVEEPSSTDYNRGSEPLQTLPAQWWNWFMNKFTSRFNKVNIYVKNLFNELAQLLSLVNVTPDGTEGAVTDGQLKNAFKELYPDYINTKLALKATYVKKTQKVNNHALSGDVTVTKSDVGLGNVPNVSTNDQTPTYTKASTLTALSSGEKLSIAFGKLAKAVSSLISHIANVSNPHSVTKAQVGLGNVVNTADSDTPTENGTDKFTNGGAYTLKKDLTDIAESLPTDAVLHYSFDDVPDYPDGTATYFKDKNFSNTSGWSAPSDFSLNIENNCLKISSNNSTRAYILARETSVMNTAVLNGKIAKVKVRSSYKPYRVVFQEQAQYTTSSLTLIEETGNEYTYCGLINFATTSTVYLVFDKNNVLASTDYVTIESIYIGDGSYSTPIIDNANGQNNATNNGGLATKGVSGKGVRLLGNGYIQGTFPFAPKEQKIFTVSLWVKNWDYSTQKYLEVNNASGNICNFCIEFRGNTTGDVLVCYAPTPNGYKKLSISASNLNIAQTFNNKITHIVFVANDSNSKMYIDGVQKNFTTIGSETTQSGDSTILQIGKWSQANSYSKADFDDLLIFDRALTENEVMALYLNKANTPKYYNINNYILDNPDSTPTQNSTNLVTSGGVYTELAKKANTTYVDTELAKKVDKTTTVNGHALSGNVTVTKSDVDLGNVVNTGDSAVPVSGGTTKFTTGGAYNLLTSLAPIFSTSTSYAVGDMVTYSGKLYTCTTAHSAGAWNASHFTVTDLNTEFQKPANNIAEDFQINRMYEKGHLVIYNKELYKCIQTTNVQLTEWDSTYFQKVSMYTKKSDRGTSLTRYVLNVSLGGQTHSVSLPALCAGSELFIRLNNDNNRSGKIELQAYHAYTLGVTYSDGGMSTLQKLTSGQELSITVAPNSYLEVSVNYINVDEEGLANLTMLTYPIPSVDYS